MRGARFADQSQVIGLSSPFREPAGSGKRDTMQGARRRWRPRNAGGIGNTRSNHERFKPYA